MGSPMGLELSQKAGLALSPQLMRVMELLQMTSQELLSYLENEAQENPVLELELPRLPSVDPLELQKKLEWLNNQPGSRQYARYGGEISYSDAISSLSTTAWEETLEAHLLIQLHKLRPARDVEAAARYLVSCVDINGYLDESPEFAAKYLKLPQSAVESALALLRSLKPDGICAANLEGCLTAQMEKLPDSELALKIIADFLPEVAHGHYQAIAKKLGAKSEEVRRQCDRIRGLDPAPGAKFADGEAPVYVIPDVFVTVENGELEVTLNRAPAPDLELNRYYCELLRTTDSDEVREYLTQKVSSAKTILQSLRQRESTVLSCSRTIVDIQRDFFSGTSSELQPMTLADVAERAGVHPSTVSRAIRGKYVQCDRGVFSMRHFFSRAVGVGTEQTSATTVKASIQRLIGAEDARSPLSDQKLCDMLSSEGVDISRRTVAKYRDELGIPGTLIRRKS